LLSEEGNGAPGNNFTCPLPPSSSDCGTGHLMSNSTVPGVCCGYPC
jgi:hypothetical protein